MDIVSVHPTRDAMLLRFKVGEDREPRNFFALTNRFTLPILQVSVVGFPEEEDGKMKVVTASMRSDLGQGAQRGEVNAKLKGGFSGGPVVSGREVIGLVESSSTEGQKDAYNFTPIRSITPWVSESLELPLSGINDREAAEISRIVDLVHEYQQDVERDYKESTRDPAKIVLALGAALSGDKKQLDEWNDKLKADRDSKIRQLPIALYARIEQASSVLRPRLKISTGKELGTVSRARGKLLTALADLQVDLSPLKGKEIVKDVYFFQFGAESEIPPSITSAGVRSPTLNPARILHLQLNQLERYHKPLSEDNPLFTTVNGKAQLPAKMYEDMVELARLIQTYGVDDKTKREIGARLVILIFLNADFAPLKGAGVFDAAIISGYSKEYLLKANPTLSDIDMSHTVFESSP